MGIEYSTDAGKPRKCKGEGGHRWQRRCQSCQACYGAAAPELAALVVEPGEMAVTTPGVELSRQKKLASSSSKFGRGGAKLTVRCCGGGWAAGHKQVL